MSELSPTITANDIITEVTGRIGQHTIGGDTFLPWISYAYQKEYNALVGVGQHVKERLFGTMTTFTLTAGTAEYATDTVMPQFGGFIRGQIKYGASGDDWVKLRKLQSLSQWTDMTDVTVTDWSKAAALIYFLKDIVGFIPTPPSTDTGAVQAKLWYLKRPVRITVSTDPIDLPYRYIYPIVSYVQAMAVMAENEDYRAAERIEGRFDKDLEEVCIAADGEESEYEEGNAVIASDTVLSDNPLAV